MQKCNLLSYKNLAIFSLLLTFKYIYDMNKLNILEKDQVPEDTQKIYEKLEGKLGTVPNIYAIMANSSHALEANLTLLETIRKGEFSDKEIEVINLSVSEINGCNYCLAAHTAAGKMAGLSEDETVEIRNGEIKDKKLKALSDLAKEITEKRGYPSEETVDRFIDAGYNKAALVELIGLVSLNVFNNYLNHIAGTEVDFPEAPVLEEQEA